MLLVFVSLCGSQPGDREMQTMPETSRMHIECCLYLLPAADIRDLISVDDVMEDKALRFGPNGGLVFCME